MAAAYRLAERAAGWSRTGGGAPRPRRAAPADAQGIGTPPAIRTTAARNNRPAFARVVSITLPNSLGTPATYCTLTTAATDETPLASTMKSM
jgi:hypothetical protein